MSRRQRPPGDASRVHPGSSLAFAEREIRASAPTGLGGKRSHVQGYLYPEMLSECSHDRMTCERMISESADDDSDRFMKDRMRAHVSATSLARLEGESSL